MRNPNYNLTHKEQSSKWDHVVEVAKQDGSPMKSKHIFIEVCNKVMVRSPTSDFWMIKPRYTVHS